MVEEALFAAALERPPGARRQAFLDETCGDDLTLRRRLERLLAADECTDDLLERGQDVLATQAGTPAPLAAEGLFAGRFRLRDKLGVGGMGEVWVADQLEPVQRRVALKVIKPGWATADLLARFAQERQALALMDHPNIARVFDAGVVERPIADWRLPIDGQTSSHSTLSTHQSPVTTHQSAIPYLVMELIEGVAITRFCDAARLSIRERLELFIPVCHAVQHAHQKGIIHRDLKPSNVLVAPSSDPVGERRVKGIPKVIDFGVAKATGARLAEDSVHTQVGSFIGTLEYVSPEQADLNNLDVDTRSDVYSLGVMLYELLTGSVPFPRHDVQPATLAEMLRVIREVDPPKPTTRLSDTRMLTSVAAVRQAEPGQLVALVRGELDWIVMKALAKERDRRYATANALAQDLQNYLDDKPIEASPPSPGYRLRKALRRHKGPVLAAALVLLVLVGGIAGTSAGLVWAVRARDDKAKALIAETEAKEAEVKEREAKEKALAAERQAREKALAALRALTNEIVENQMARGTTLTEENKSFLRQIIKHFEGFAAVTADDAESRAIRAEGYHRVGLMRHRLGEMNEAVTAYADALALRKQLSADFPNRPEFRQDLAETQNSLGVLLKDTGRLKEAETAYGECLVLQKLLATDFPNRPEFREGLARSHGNLGNLLSATGWPTQAETAYVDALALQKQLVAEFPSRPELRQDLARSHNNLGVLLKDAGRAREAEMAYEDALALRKGLAADFPTWPEYRQELAGSYNNLGLLRFAMGKPKEAEAAYADALVLRKRLAADFPTRPEYRQELARSYNNLGILLKDTGRPKEAETAYANALALQKQLAIDIPNQPDLRNHLAGTCVNLAILHLGQRDFRGATAYLAEAEPHHEAALQANPRHPAYRRFYRNNLAVLIQANAGLCDQAGAKQAADKMRDLGWDPPTNAYKAACYLSLCIPIVQKDDQATKEVRDQQARYYSDEAMKMLRAAVAKGAKYVAQMKTDTDLDPLRRREDFQKLLVELEATIQPTDHEGTKRLLDPS